MSNSLKQKLRGKTIKIFGPPGTGKTENLLKRVQRYLKQGFSPDEICYISFTNKAVNECVARVRKRFKEYDEDDFKYFRTLHSLARQQFAEIPVLDPKADMLMFHTQYGTIKVNYKDSSKSFSVLSRIDTEKEVNYFKNNGILPYVFNLIRS